jgi:hypothetical protein
MLMTVAWEILLYLRHIYRHQFFICKVDDLTSAATDAADVCWQAQVFWCFMRPKDSQIIVGISRSESMKQEPQLVILSPS